MKRKNGLINDQEKVIAQKKCEEFFNYYKKQSLDQTTKSAYSFNVLKEQCGSIVENSHTNMLIRLLEYYNKYGYVFLEEFILMSGFDITIDNTLDVHFEKEYFVECENDRKGRIDGFIYQKGKFAIIIENKINHAGNQPEQIKRYIKAILKEQLVNRDHIFVVFLTRDGVENPDNDSFGIMREIGICDKDDDGQITGSRYFSCSYSQNILNWLKDDIQPLVPQKDVVLNAGIIQYIDYLEGLLGCRTGEMELQKRCTECFDKLFVLPDNIIDKNTYLYKLYLLLSEKKCSDVNYKTEAVNILKNIIELKNDELMELFLNVTKDYFTKGKEPLIHNYHLNHHFTYYYITIKDKDWPKGIDFGWYPLGLKRLNEGKELVLSFKFGGKMLTDNYGQYLKDLKFVFSKDSKSYRKIIKITKSGNFSADTFFGLSETSQKVFLEKVYSNFVEPIIKNIIPNYKNKTNDIHT